MAGYFFKKLIYDAIRYQTHLCPRGLLVFNMEGHGGMMGTLNTKGVLSLRFQVEYKRKEVVKPILFVLNKSNRRSISSQSSPLLNLR